MEDWRKIDYGAFQKHRMVQGRQAVYFLAVSTRVCTSWWSSARYLSILYKVWGWTSMWLGRKEKLNKTDVRVYGLTLKCLTLPPPSTISPYIIQLQLAVVIPFISITTGGSATTYSYTFTFNFFHFEKIRCENSDTECSMFRLYNAH